MAEELQVRLVAKDMLSNAMGKAGQAMADLEGKSEDLKSGFQSLSMEQQDLIEGLGMLAGQALLSAGNAALEFGGDMNRAMGVVAAQTGMAGEELEEFRASALAIYETGAGESVEQVAQAMSLVQRQTEATGATLEDLTANALTLASAFDADVQESTRAVRQMMINMGVDGEAAFDLVTVAMQRTGDPANDILDTINEYSAVFSEAGFSAEEMTATLIAGLEGGAFNADKVGDTVNEFMTRLTDGSETTRQALDTLTGSADNFLGALDSGAVSGKEALDLVIDGLRGIESPLERDQTAVMLFGSMWEDLGPQAIMALGDVEGGLENVAGATDEAAEAMAQGPEAAIERLQRKALTMITPVVDGVNSLEDSTIVAGLAVAGLGKAAVMAAGGTQALATALGTTQVALGAVALAVGSVILAYEKWKDLQNTIAEGQAKVNEQLDTWTQRAAEMTGEGMNLSEVSLELADSINAANAEYENANFAMQMLIDNEKIQTDAAVSAEAAIRSQASSYQEYIAAVETANATIENRAGQLQVVSEAEFNATTAVQEETEAHTLNVQAMQEEAAASQSLTGMLEGVVDSSVSAATAMAEAHREAAAAAAEHAEETAGLAESLMDATSQQIASQMIEMLDPEKMGAEAYSAAIQEIGVTFGVMDEESIALAENMDELAAAIESGVIPAENADEALQALIEDAKDGKVSMRDLTDEFSNSVGGLRNTESAFRGIGSGMQSVSENAGGVEEGIRATSGAFGEGAPVVEEFASNLGTTEGHLVTLVDGSSWTLTVNASYGGGGGGDDGGGDDGGGPYNPQSSRTGGGGGSSISIGEINIMAMDEASAAAIADVIYEELASRLALLRA